MKNIIILAITLITIGCGTTPLKYKIPEEPTKIITEESIIYDNDSTDEPVKLIVSIAPNYPTTQYKNLVTGNVEMSIIINEFGSVIDVKVLNSNPKGVFDREAIRAISKWKYKPAYNNKTAVIVKMKQNIIFELE